MVSLYNNWIISYREVIQTKLHTGKINPSALHSFFNLKKKVFSTLFVIFETFFTYRATWFYYSSRDVFSLRSDSFFFIFHVITWCHSMLKMPVHVFFTWSHNDIRYVWLNTMWLNIFLWLNCWWDVFIFGWVHDCSTA